jgi:hypothetical protein
MDPLLAYGRPVQAIVAAFGLEERTQAAHEKTEMVVSGCVCCLSAHPWLNVVLPVLSGGNGNRQLRR